MKDNTQEINRKFARSLAICSLAIVALLILKKMHIFDFSGMLGVIIPVLGFVTTLSPIVLYYLKVSDNFLKYYMIIMLGILVGCLGCFNNIGIYITFVLAPLASCLYFDIKYTQFSAVFSYLVMVAAVYVNTAGKFETVHMGWSHFETFRAYLIGFSIEYVVISVFLFGVVKRAHTLVEEQRQAFLAQKAQDARYQLLVKEMKDIVFEYYPGEGRYVANRSIFQKEDETNAAVTMDAFDMEFKKYPGLERLYHQFSTGLTQNHIDPFELDMSYEAEGRIVPLWFQVECFVLREEGAPVTLIGKMHDITRTKLNQEAIRKQNLEQMRKTSRRKNSLFEQIVKESEAFTEADFGKMAGGHRFLAQMMEDIKYSENLVEGIDQMLSQIGKFFLLDRICVVETDMTSGTSCVNYQWNSKEENYLENYFTAMSLEDVRRTIETYDRYGCIEVNPSLNIETTSENQALLEDVVYSVLLGNQIWIPMLANGRYIGAICFDRYDTTRYSAVEKFLLSEAVNSVTAHIMKINAEKANKAKSDFLSTMSHEIRTPMNAIVGMTEVALREDMSDNVKQRLMTVKSSAFGLLTLINDILDYSKIEAGKFDIVPENFSLLSILNDVKEIVMARNNGKLEIEFQVPDDVPMKLYGDSVRIKQVMINYCTNAIKYSDRGKVEIRVVLDKKDENSVLLTFSVKDQGIGIKKEDLSKLFQAYTRVDSTVNHHKEGTGLGLMISKQLVELMDGYVSVESEYGVGSTFSFVIPLGIKDWTPAGRLEDYRYEEEMDEAEDDETLVLAPDARVLIVDDTFLNLMVAEALMEPTKMKTDTAESGEDALRMIEREDYDLIFMDHFMPGMDGVETTERIRAMSDPKKSHIPIVALTADAMEGVREELLSKGMDDFLTKPIVIKDLGQVLKKWLPQEKIVKQN